MAKELYQSLLTQVASEHFYFWLNSLKEFSHAEQCLTGLQEDDYSSALSVIAESLRSYHKGIASLMVSIPSSFLLFTAAVEVKAIDLLHWHCLYLALELFVPSLFKGLGKTNGVFALNLLFQTAVVDITLFSSKILQFNVWSSLNYCFG